MRQKLRETKQAALNEPHMEPLTAFVGQLRMAQPDKCIPDFDPDDGGTDAKVLFVLEAPGPKAIETGFVSQDNPDQTAGNLKAYLEEAGIRRKQSLLWNIVPWYLGTGAVIRAAASADIQESSVCLEQLLALLPHLQAVVLVGRKAQSAFQKGAMTTAKPLYETYHPSPVFVHRHPDNRKKIVEKLHEVAAKINGI